MTLHEMKLVQESFSQVAPIGEAAAELFYGRLFELDPKLRPMFPADMKEQGRKLMQMLVVAVRGLDRLDETLPSIRALSQKHSGYGVTSQHYDTVASALLWTLELGLGNAFTTEVRSAWTSVYTLLATEMRAGAMAAAA